MKHQLLTLTIVGALSLIAGSSGMAASETWMGGTGTQSWNSTGNWSSSTIPGNTGTTTDTSVATFNTATAGTAVTIDSTRNVESITFATSAGTYTIGSAGANSGNSLQLTSAGTISIASTFTGSGITETVNAPLVLEPATSSTAGTYSFTNNAAAGSGNLLNFAGNISGGTTSSSITLSLNGTNTGAINTISGKISTGNASTFSIGVSGSTTWLLSGDNSGITGAGTVSLSAGSTAFSGGTLLIGSNTALGSDSVSLGAGSNGATANFGAGAGDNVTISNNFTGNSTSASSFVGSGNLTINGSFTPTIITNTGLYNFGTGTLTFGGAFNLSTITTGSAVFQMRGPGNTTFSSTSTINNSSAVGTGKGTFINFGTGTLTIAGTYAATGSFYDFGGTLALNTSSSGVRLPNASLILGGTTVDLSGSGGSNQTVTGTTFRPGQTTIQDTNSGSSYLSLGGVTASTGGLVNFNSGAATTSSSNSSGILGVAFTYGGTDWAVGNGATTAISGYSSGSYTPFASATSSNNALLTGSGSLGTSVEQNTLKINSTTGSPQSLAISNGVAYTFNAGGLLYVGSDNYSITGGTLNNVAGQLDVQQWGSGSLTIGSVIADRFGAVQALVKGGTGTLTLSGTNSYTGLTYINDGTVSISSDANLGGQNSVSVTSSSTSSPTVTLAATAPSDLVVGSSFLGSTVLSVSTNTVTLNGNANQSINNVSGTSVGFITSTGNLTLVLNGGTLSATSSFSLAETLGSQTVNRSISLGANGGTLDVTNSNTLTVAGVISNLIDATPGYNITPLAALTKTSGGTLILSGLNTYSGGTNINGGVLNLGVAQGTTSGPLGSSASSLPVPSDLISFGGGTLQYSSVNQTDYSTVFSTAANQAYSIDTNGQTVSFAGALTSSGGTFTKLGTGTLTFSGVGANTYSGLTTVSAGELDLNKTPGVNAITGAGALNIASPDVLVSGGTLKWLASNQVADNATISVTTGGTVNLNSFSDTIGDFSNSGGTFSTGSGKLKGTGASITWSGGTNTINAGGTVEDEHVVITGGTNVVQGEFSGPGSTGGVLQVDSGGTGLEMTGSSLALNSDFSSAGELLLQSGAAVTTHASSTTSTISTDTTFSDPGFIDLSGGNSTFTVAKGTTASKIDLSISAVIQDGALTKAGTGALQVTNANTYAGGTTVSAGTFYANTAYTTAGAVSSTGTGAVGVSGTGVLAGSGTIAPSSSATNGVSIGAGGALASGLAQSGTTVDGSHLTLDNTAGLGTTNSKAILSVSGTGTLTSSANLTFSLGSGNTSGDGNYVFGTPNSNSTYLNVVGNTAGEINFAGTDSVTINDLTGGNLSLRQGTPYLLIGTSAGGDADFTGLVTSLDGTTDDLTLDGNGYVMGVGTSTSSYTTIGITELGLGSAPAYTDIRLYLSNGELEVVPEPGTWALMLGGVALLVVIQRRKNKLG